jgi:hypothetical protein
MILVSVTLTFAQERYRAIGEPTLVLLTAVAIEELWRRRRPEDEAQDATTDAPVPVG